MMKLAFAVCALAVAALSFGDERAPADDRSLRAREVDGASDLACSSHNAMWEKNRLLMFKASLDWLTTGSVNGMKEGTLRLGY